MVSVFLARVWSLFHLVFFFAATILGAVLAIASAPFDRSGDTVLVLARIWSRLVLAVGRVRLSVREETPGALEPAATYVFMANHASAIDIWALFVLLRRNIRFIAKKQLGRIPVFGWAMMAGRFIFIDRGNPVAARRSIDEAARRIRGGCSVAIFPEGTRSRDGRVAAFKKGGFHLAMNAGVAIVPIGIRGAGEAMRPGSLLMRGGRVEVVIGKPISTEGLVTADREALVDRVRAEILRLSGQPAVPTPSDASAPAASDAAAAGLSVNHAG